MDHLPSKVIRKLLCLSSISSFPLLYLPSPPLSLPRNSGPSLMLLTLFTIVLTFIMGALVSAGGRKREGEEGKTGGRGGGGGWRQRKE